MKLDYELEHGRPREPGPRPVEDETTVLTEPDPKPYRPRTVPRWLTAVGQSEVAMYVQAGQSEVALHVLLPLLQQRHEDAASRVKAAMGRGASGPYLLLADAAAKALGVNIGLDGWSSPEAKPLRDSCQRAYLEAFERLAQRDSGYVVDTPVAPTAPLQAQVGRGHRPTA